MPYLNVKCPACGRCAVVFHNVRKCRSCGKSLEISMKPPVGSTDIVKSTGGLLRFERTRRGLSQRAVARDAGLSVSFVCDVEAGRRGVGLDSWIALCKALDVKPDALLRSLLKAMKVN